MQAVRLSLIVASMCVAVACIQQSPSRPTPTVSEGLDPGSQGTGRLVSGGIASTQGIDSGLPMSATIAFGRPDTGSPFPPPSGHDQSSHAKDNLVPRTVVIAQGGTVRFDLSGPGRAVHQVAIYPDGTEPRDVDTTALAPPPAGCPPVPLIADGNVLAPPPCAGGSTSPSYTFTEPGRYLVICTFLPHFVDAQMYGWVIVK
jgi:plastocyanin